MEGTVVSFVVKSEEELKRKTLQAVLEQCQKSLESLSEGVDDDDGGDEDGDGGQGSSSGCADDKGADELCDLLRSRVECLDFLEKLETARMSVSQHLVDEYSSWDMVSKNDLWDGDLENLDLDEYALVGQEDIVDGIACFMAAYLLSINQTKDVTPNQLQDASELLALSKTFAVKKKKGKLRKVWDGSKVVYNAASWGATAIGIYQNPVVVRVATVAFWTSCHVISKLF